jgi:hypothetical protein
MAHWANNKGYQMITDASTAAGPLGSLAWNSSIPGMSPLFREFTAQAGYIGDGGAGFVVAVPDVSVI